MRRMNWMLRLKIQAAARPKLPGAAACPPQNEIGFTRPFAIERSSVF